MFYRNVSCVKFYFNYFLKSVFKDHAIVFLLCIAKLLECCHAQKQLTQLMKHLVAMYQKYYFLGNRITKYCSKLLVLIYLFYANKSLIISTNFSLDGDVQEFVVLSLLLQVGGGQVTKMFYPQ